MSNSDPAACNETADEYGRLEQCFYDHHGAPFRLQDHLAELHDTRQITESAGLINQPGLHAMSLPRPNITVDSFDDTESGRLSLLSFFTDSYALPPLCPEHDAFKELQISLGGLDLGPDLDLDLQTYLGDVEAKRHCDISNQWLPLSPVKSEKDQALSFPPYCERFQSLLIRELQHENIAISGHAALLEEEAQGLLSATTNKCPLTPRTPKGLLARHAEPVTPPLSPVSDDDDLPYVPDSTLTFIDLTSEPSSPINSNFELLQTRLEAGTLDSDPPPHSSATSASPAVGQLVSQDTTRLKLHDLKMDLPIVITSSETSSNGDAFEDLHLSTGLCAGEPEAPNDVRDMHFEDALQDIIEARQADAAKLVEQERLNPSDSISRVVVPILEFGIAEPEWVSHATCPRAHFTWLQECTPTPFKIPRIIREARLDSALKWTPVPSGQNRSSTNEEPPPLTPASRQLLSIDAAPTLSSANYAPTKHKLTILRATDGDEIEAIEDEVLPGAERPIEPGTSPAADDDGASGRKIRDNLATSSKGSRTRPLDQSAFVLPTLDDLGATTKLLSGFMELRAAKRPRLSNPTGSAPGSARQASMATIQPSSSNLLPRQEQLVVERQQLHPAPAPECDVPLEKGSFIVSVGLGPAILRNLEKSWPQDHLIDRDFSRHNTMAWSPGTAQPKEKISPLTFEADLCLTPTIGVLITTLLKVKQRPLPGSKTQTPLRERVSRVSQRYESLVVLVSEANPAGEFIGNLSPADTAAYADFIRFTVALAANVTVYFSPGADDTLSKWLLHLMCRHSQEAVACKSFLSTRETTWEVFLRRAGMNIVAAQVLSGALFEEAGAEGMARFIAMATQGRVLRYAVLMGGDTMLLQSSAAIDRRWT